MIGTKEKQEEWIKFVERNLIYDKITDPKIRVY